MSSLVAGPQWSLEGLQVAAGRFPLGVEQHMLRMVALLVPGATTVTPHGRYYALHALAGVEAGERQLDRPAALALLRRMEVVMAGVSVLHEQDPVAHSHWPRPHGADVVGPQLRSTGELDMATLSKAGTGGYVKAEVGYWGPYIGSEYLLGITSSATIPTPGAQCDPAALRGGLGDLVALARYETVDADTLAAAFHLCLCAGGDATDGAWLRKLLCKPAGDGDEAKSDRTRRATVRLLGRVVGNGVDDFAEAFVSKLGFGDFLATDPVAAGLEEAEVWRGVILRQYSVGAWRRLWAWLVDQVVDVLSVEQLADVFADNLPDCSVNELLAQLPATTDADGQPVHAEDQVREAGLPVPTTELRVLALGGKRARELSGRVGEAFRGRPVELAPEWVARHFEAAGGEHVRDFGRRLVEELVVRARRIAMSKMVRRPDGTIWLPTRLHEKGGLLWRTSSEGSGDVGLRIAQLGTVLAGAGVFAWNDGPVHGRGWALTDAGQASLA